MSIYKNRVLVFTLTIMCYALLSHAHAQRGSAYPIQGEGPSDFVKNLWYGGGAALGFASSNNQSDFIIGLFPMAGYKITPEFSAGVRIGATYNHSRFNIGAGTERFNLIDFSFAPLARYKVLPEIFIHGEAEILSDEFVFRPFGQNDFTTSRETFLNPMLGLGYITGNFEILVLYNFNENDNSLRIPIVFRAGYIVNF